MLRKWFRPVRPHHSLPPATSLWSAATLAPLQCSPPSLTPGWIRVENQTTGKLGGKRVIPLNLSVGDPTHETQVVRDNAVVLAVRDIFLPHNVDDLPAVALTMEFCLPVTLVSLVFPALL